MIREPYYEKAELLKNLGARRAQLQEQKIDPLLDEFDVEIEDHSVLRDLKIVMLFRQFIEYFQEYFDLTEEAYNHLVSIIGAMIKINEENYVPRADYEELKAGYDNQKVMLKNLTGGKRREDELEVKPGDDGLTKIDKQRESFMRKVDREIYKAILDGKDPAKMKHAMRFKLNIKRGWEGHAINSRIDEFIESRNRGKTFDWTINTDEVEAEHKINDEPE